MKKKFYHEERTFKIYALYDDVVEKRAFIGKTISRMSTVYSRHRYGGNRHTQELFEIDCLEPDMVVLEELLCTGAVAYRHVLAWVKCFEEQGFVILNPKGTLIQAEQMQDQTLKIYEQLLEIPFAEHLSRTHQEHRVVPQRVQEKKENEPASTHLCIRMSPTDKREFQRYCRDTNLRQTDALAQLLHTSGENALPNIRRLSGLLDETEARCTKLAEENEKLRSGLALPRSERIENNARESFQFIQKAIQSYVKLTYTKDQYTFLPIKEYRYDDFKRRFPDAAQYHYPAEEGCYTVFLQALVWGKSRNPVYFLMCKTQEGECLKFRFYPKREFTGMKVRQSLYAQLDSLWMFAGRMAPDGAVDLWAAFPLLRPMKAHPNDKKSLDEQIMYAASKIK